MLCSALDWDGGWVSIAAASQTLLLSSLDDCVWCSDDACV